MLALIMLPSTDWMQITMQDGQPTPAEGRQDNPDVVYDAYTAYEQLRNGQTVTMPTDADMWAAVLSKMAMNRGA